MYHPYSKDDPLLRKAIYNAYSKKCVYCGDYILPKNLHIDHILATNAKDTNDKEMNNYLDELSQDGFILDSIENYIPSCAACNLKKGNRNFNVSNLRFYHDEAKKKASTILKNIDKYKNQNIDFEPFDPDYEYWEKIDFSKQKDISEAIAGYRLQPCHVIACPRLMQVEEIKQTLDIVDYAIIDGEPGCGKSISVYQAAFDLSMQGYIVYRYINKNTDDYIGVPSTDDDKKLLLIVDDAQNVSNYYIDKLLSQSNKQLKIILAYTKLAKYKSPYPEVIRITNFDAVKTIAQNYRKRKQEILPIVKKYDNSVGDEIAEVSFEQRVKNAASKNTPWLFNYTLRGGWSTASSQFQSVYNHNRCGLLSVAIALFQILKNDSAIDFKWLKAFVHKIDSTIAWSEDDLRYLMQNKIITSLDDVRIVHIESAKIIFNSFCNIADDSSKQFIVKIIENGYKEHIYSEFGLILLYYVSLSFINNGRELLFSERLLDSVFSNLNEVTDDKQRGDIVYLMTRIFHLRSEKNGKYYYSLNKQILSQWLSNTTSQNAYEYSFLLNELNNEHDNSLKSFVLLIDINKIIQNFSVASIEKLYLWSKFFNRLMNAYDPNGLVTLGGLLSNSLIKKCQEVQTKDIEFFYPSMSEMFYINPELILKLLTDTIDKFGQFCRSNIDKAIDIFDFRFNACVCGLSYFTKNKPSKAQKEFSKLLTKELPIKEVANYINYSLPRDWHGLFDLGRLLYRDNKSVYSKIVNSINYEILNKNVSHLWKNTNGDIHLLFSFIACGDFECAKRFFMLNIEKIEDLGIVFVKYFPQQTIGLYNKGVKIRLFENGWNNETYFALEALHNTSAEDLNHILCTEALQIVNKINRLCILDFDGEEKPLSDILNYLYLTCPDVFGQIIPLLDFQLIAKGVKDMLKDYRWGRNCKKRLVNMIDLLIKCSDLTNIDQLQALRALV